MSESKRENPLTGDAALASRIAVVVGRFPSQQAAAQEAGVSLSQLKRYISGENEPSLRAAAKLARAAKINLGWLAFGEGRTESGPDDDFAAERPLFEFVVQKAAEFEAKNGLHIPAEKRIETYRFLCASLKGERERRLLKGERPDRYEDDLPLIEDLVGLIGRRPPG